ncbi:MAG: sigma-70 family RNA polymerase sigma factor [Clostridia bacterium]
MNSASVPDNVQELERMMTQYGDGVLRMCYIMLHDAELARDATQDSFVKAYRALPRSLESEKAWLMRIAINTCKDYRRSHWWKVIDRSITIDALPEPAQDAVIPDDTLMLAIMKLPEKQRQVVLLHYYQGMTLEEIAQSLRKPAATVRSHLREAKKALGQALKGWYYDD